MKYESWQTVMYDYSVAQRLCDSKTENWFCSFHWNLNQSLTEVWETLLSGWTAWTFCVYKSNGRNI